MVWICWTSRSPFFLQIYSSFSILTFVCPYLLIFVLFYSLTLVQTRVKLVARQPSQPDHILCLPNRDHSTLPRHSAWSWLWIRKTSGAWSGFRTIFINPVGCSKHSQADHAILCRQPGLCPSEIVWISILNQLLWRQKALWGRLFPKITFWSRNHPL